MKVVLGSNVFISAFASRGLCVEILRICIANHDLILSEHLLHEIQRGFGRKLKMPGEACEQNIRIIRALSRMEIPADVPRDSCRDPKDLPVLGLVSASRADYLVSGDGDLLSLKKYKGCMILSPRSFFPILKEGKGP